MENGADPPRRIGVRTVERELVPTGKGRKRWTGRWKAPFAAFRIAFGGRLTPSDN